MTDVPFDEDLDQMRRTLDETREELLGVLRSLKDSDLEAQRRGGWTVQRILEHVIQSEHLYARLIQNLRGQPPSQEPLPAGPDSAAAALEQEDNARKALRDAFEGIDEETFYAMGRIGHEEYSVLSILENEANHEREHAEQIRTVLAAT